MSKTCKRHGCNNAVSGGRSDREYCTTRCQQRAAHAAFRARKKAERGHYVMPDELRRRIGYASGAARLGISVEEYSAHRDGGELWCSMCRTWKAAALFHNSKQRQCRKCHNKRTAQSRLAQRQAARAAKRERAAQARQHYYEQAMNVPTVPVSWMKS